MEEQSTSTSSVTASSAVDDEATLDVSRSYLPQVMYYTVLACLQLRVHYLTNHVKFR